MYTSKEQYMKRVYFVFLLIMLVFTDIAPLFAQAESNSSIFQTQGRKWLLSIEIPTSYAFNKPAEGDALEPSVMPFGILFFAQSPYLVGLGLEKYHINLTDNSTSSTIDNRISILMADAFYTLPIPIVIVGLGAGIGYAEVEGANEGNFDRTMAYQYFVRVGVPIKDICQVYLNVHKVTAQMKFKNDDLYLEAGGIMSSLGVGIEF